MLNFNEELHQYTNDKGDVYVSCTQLIEHYTPKFDKEFWLYYKVLQEKAGFSNDEEGKKLFSKWLTRGYGFSFKHKSIEALQEIAEKIGVNIVNVDYKDREWKKENKKSTDKGTKFHNLQEKNALTEGKGILSNGISLVYRSYNGGLENTSFGENGVEGIPELRLYNHEYKLAGTADDPVFYPKKIVEINDFKGLSLDTDIPTKLGWKKMKDINVGDEIFDGKGNITKVKDVSQIHYNPCYKLTFDCGEEIIADHEHRWVVFTGLGNRKNKENVFTTEEIFNYSNTKKTPVRIKNNSIELEETDLPIDPYVLGLWLADGNRTVGTITCVNNNIWEEIHKRGYKTSVNHNRNFDKAESRTIFGIKIELEKLNLIKNKHIPLKYLRSSYKQRLDLLRGFCDGDGYFNRVRNRVAITTTKEWQRDAIIELVSSLGWKVVSFPYKTKGFGKENIQAYSVCFTPSENPFLCRNKDFEEVMKNKRMFNSEYKYIKKIEKIDTVPTKCLAVESEEHTYMVTKHYIVTHNTNKKIITENKWEKMLYPLNKYDNCNYVHYNIQLSLYGWMLEQFGYKVRNLQITHYLFNEQEEPIASKVYKFDYLKKDVEKLLNHYVNNKGHD